MTISSLWLLLLALDWKGITAICVAVTGLITLLTLLWNKMVKPAWNVITQAWTCLKRAETYMQTLEDIASEFKPNGGNSLRDVINRLEKASLKMNAQLNSIREYSDIPSWESDHEGNITWMSRSLIEMLGLPVESSIVTNWLDAVDRHEQPRVTSVWKRAQLEAKDFYDTFTLGVETPHKVLSRGYVVKSPKGELVGFVGTIEVIQ